MNSFQLFVSVFTTLVLIYASHREVSAAPDPCFLKEYIHKEVEKTTIKPTDVPELIEEFKQLKAKKDNYFEELVRGWRK